MVTIRRTGGIVSRRDGVHLAAGVVDDLPALRGRRDGPGPRAGAGRLSHGEPGDRGEDDEEGDEAHGTSVGARPRAVERPGVALDPRYRCLSNEHRDLV